MLTLNDKLVSLIMPDALKKKSSKKKNSNGSNNDRNQGNLFGQRDKSHSGEHIDMVA